MKTYTVTLTEQHLRVLLRALDFFQRIGKGQFKELFRLCVYFRRNWNALDPSVEDQLNALRVVLMPELKDPKEYHSIRSPEIEEDFRTAYDMQQVVRWRLAWDKYPEGGWTVDFDTPSQTGAVDLIDVRKKE
jgi:hypothetical protein